MTQLYVVADKHENSDLYDSWEHFKCLLLLKLYNKQLNTKPDRTYENPGLLTRW